MREVPAKLIPVLNEVADWYEAQPVLPTDGTLARTARIYEILGKELNWRIYAIADLVRIRRVGYDPYRTSKELWAAVCRGELDVYTGGDPHPLLGEDNIASRIEHDFLHTLHRLTFSTEDELRLGLRSQQYHPYGGPAILTETCGQTAYYWRHRTYAPQKATLFPTVLRDKLATVLEENN